jgi:hypothetical protein
MCAKSCIDDDIAPLRSWVALTTCVNSLAPDNMRFRACSSNTNYLDIMNFLKFQLTNNRQNIVLAENHKSFILLPKLGPAILAHQNLVANFKFEFDNLALVIFSRSNSNNFGLLTSFLGGIGDSDPSCHLFLLIDLFHKNAIPQRSNNFLHDLHILWIKVTCFVTIDNFEIPINDIFIVFVFDESITLFP